jgi:type I restriction enzyme S subunit
MSRLPLGWAEATIRDVTARVPTIDPKAAPDTKFTYVDISSVDNQTNRVISPKSLSGRDAPSRARQLLRSGDTVFSTVRTYLRNIGFIDNSLAGSIGSTGLCVLRPAPGVHPRFLYYYSLTNSFVDSLSAQMRGTSYPAVVDGQVRSMPIPIPPTAEQERIVAALEEQLTRLDAGATALDRVRGHVKIMRGAILNAAMSGRLVGRLTNWAERPLGPLLADIHAGKSFKCDERPARADEWGVVKVSAMTWGEFRENENKTVLPERAIDARLEIRPGDVLVSRSNTLEYVGAVVRVKSCRPKLLLSDKSLRVVPTSELTPEWLVISLRSAPARRYIEAVATGTSDSMRNISQPKLRALSIPLPPVDDQLRIAAEVDRLMSALNTLEATLTVTGMREATCRRSVLSAAFSGTLVPQDPDDEPASQLLQSIEADRALQEEATTHNGSWRTERGKVKT